MKRRHRLLMPICRHLPPSIAYRIYYRYVYGIHGSPDRFENVRAMYGKARLSSSMADIVDAMFAFHGCSEWLGLTLCHFLTKPGETIFEIGANIGTDTLNMAAIVGSSGRVVSMEPGSACFLKLKERVEENRLSQVTVVQKAVSEEPGRFVLQAGTDVNSGMAYLGPASASTEGETVETTTIAALSESFGRPNFIWMDIEGFELKALRGGSDILRSARPFIYTEVDRGHLERAGDSLEAFEKFVVDHGYQAVDPTSWRLPSLRMGHAPPGYYHANWLLVPNEKMDSLISVRPKFLAARLLPRL
jgi:FkbM family methyltransferase